MQQLEPQVFVSWVEPIEMLYACHSKVKRFCRQLRILPDYLAQNGLNQTVKNDIQQILNYFNLAAPLHHEDEEREFFPLLVKSQPQVQADIDELERQHEILHANWAALSVQLEALLAGACETVEVALIQRFIEGYDVHLAIEEPLFELGKATLAAEELKTIGELMAVRRKA